MGGGLRVPIYFYKNPYIDAEGEFVEDSPSLTAGSQKMLTGGDSMKRYDYVKTLSLHQLAEFLALNDIYITDDPDDNAEWLGGEVEDYERVD